MGFLDWIKNLFDNGKTNTKIYATNLNKIKGESTPLKVALKDTNGNNLSNKSVIFNIVGKDYVKTTDNQGIATLNINLNCGEYTCKLNFKEDDIYNSSNAYADIIISPLIEADDLTMNQGDGSKFKAKLTDTNGNIQSNTDLSFNILGKTYPRTTDQNGEATLNINLNEGEYSIETVSYNIHKSNKVKVNVKPVPPTPPKPSGRHEQILNLNANPCDSGFTQCTDYYCACNSVQCILYYLTGIMVSEYTLAKVMGTTQSGTGHDGINTAISWFNRNYAPNLSVEWKSFGELGFEGLAELFEAPNTGLFLHLLYRDKWGHYEVPRIINLDTKYVQVYNSLSGGYLEDRTFETQRRYINGISQKGVCIIRRTG